MALSPFGSPAPAESPSAMSQTFPPSSPPPEVAAGNSNPPTLPVITLPLPPENTIPPMQAPPPLSSITSPPPPTTLAPTPKAAPIISPPALTQPQQPPVPTFTPPPLPPEATPSPISIIKPVSPPILPPQPPMPPLSANPILPPPKVTFPPHSPLPPPPPPSTPKNSPPPNVTIPISAPPIPSKNPIVPTTPLPPSTRPNYPPPPDTLSHSSLYSPPRVASPVAAVTSPPSVSLPLASGSILVSSKQSHLSTGIIVGGAIGGIFLLFLLGILIWMYGRGRNRCNSPHRHNNPTPIAPVLLSKHTQQSNPLASHMIKPPSTLVPLSSSIRGSQSINHWTENHFPPNAPHISRSLPSGTFKYTELEAATDGFTEDNLLGQGGFGCVYKGFLKSGKEVAVKRLKEGSRQGDREFQAEVEIISRVHHKHLVSLVGYCIRRAERLLVYEFVPNKTLQFHLHGNGQPVMEWETRLRIAIGSAKGVAYLHEDCNPTIIHRDVKAANILLDHKFEAKLSDFGLAKNLSGSGTGITHISTKVVGTFGYLAPEYASSGKVTEKSDVYSYGVMLLELITGRPPISETESEMKNGLVEWARPLLARALEEDFEALVDPRLDHKYNTSEMSSMAACANACVRNSAWLRPRMNQVVRALEGDISADDLNNSFDSMGCSTNNSDKYDEDIKTFNWTSLGWKYGINWQSGSSSFYGLNPSSSSSNTSSK